MFCDEVVDRPTQVWEETIILFLYRVGKDIVPGQNVTVVHVKGSELILSHGVDLGNVGWILARRIKKGV